MSFVDPASDWYSAKFLQWFMQYLTVLDRVITALDCTYISLWMKGYVQTFGALGMLSWCQPVTSSLWTSGNTTSSHYPADNLKGYTTNCITFQLLTHPHAHRHSDDILHLKSCYACKHMHICTHKLGFIDNDMSITYDLIYGNAK